MKASIDSEEGDEREKSNTCTREWDAHALEYCADSVEFCPIEGFQDLFVCGNYQLVSGETQEKCGRILLYKVSTDDGTDERKDTQNHKKMTLLSSLDTSASFDVKWSGHRIAGGTLLGDACADGGLNIYKLEQSEDNDENELQSKIVCIHSTVYKSSSVYIDWNNRVANQESTRVCASHSNGDVSCSQLGQEGALTQMVSWKAHDLEVWVASFNQWQPDIIYSGSDDCKFKGWDLRMGGRVAILNNSVHSMGVCSIQTHPYYENLLATGSYDEQVRLWDTRQLRRSLWSHGLGGGVWRLKWHPTQHDRLLAGCMHNGFHVISVECLESDPGNDLNGVNGTVVSSFYDHKSLAYGCDWSYAPDQTSLIASCSFYDKSLCLWDCTSDHDPKTFDLSTLSVSGGGATNASPDLEKPDKNETKSECGNVGSEYRNTGNESNHRINSGWGENFEHPTDSATGSLAGGEEAPGECHTEGVADVEELDQQDFMDFL